MLPPVLFIIIKEKLDCHHEPTVTKVRMAAVQMLKISLSITQWKR